MTWISYLPLGLYVVNVTAFAWGAFFFFVKPGPESLWYRLVQVVSICVWAVQSYGLVPRVDQELGLILSTSMMFILSGALFFWTLVETQQRRLSLIYSEDLPGFLNRQGPYRFVRHPFYSSYLISYLGAAIAAWSIPGLVAFVVIAGVYLHAARTEETKFQRSPFAHEYERYRREVRGFIPFVF